MNDRCSSCPRSHRQILPSGPTDARIMLIGDRPTKWENERGEPFCGQGGQELDRTYLPLAGLERRDIYMTYAVQCECVRNGQDVEPGEALIKVCSENHLPAEIAAVHPDTIIACGATACKLFGDVDLEFQHGRPFKDHDLGCWIMPMYSPGAGMKDTRYMTPMLADWELFGKWLRAKHEYAVPDTNRTAYKLLTGATAVRDYLHSHLDFEAAVDTESDEGRIWSIQFSFKPGNAAMVLAEDRPAVHEVAWALNRCDRLIMHNATYDIEELAQVGIRARDWRDTMQELYHLGNLPQGLKAAVYRVFGYRMTSYMDTVVPHSKAALNGWLAEALMYAQDFMRDTEAHPPGKGCPTCGKNHRLDVSKQKSHESEAVIRRIMSRLDDPTSTYDAWQKPKYAKGKESCRLLGRDWLDDLEVMIGRMPRQSIVHAPLDEAVQYGCSDADWTMRLSRWLEQERARIVKDEWNVGRAAA